MASFNLGQVKGEKGDKGDTGPKGERGERGEKGETGANGIDGRTPVFTVGETVTLSSDEEAYVELNSEDIENPVLSFFIPRGHDGRDSMGDMLSAVYDTGGKGEDFYKYADSLHEKTLKKDGGILTGSLSACETDGKEPVVRNISMRSSLPDEAVEGDICIICDDKNRKTLGECEIGDILIVKEHNEGSEYIIVAKDYHGAGNITLVKKTIPTLGVKFNHQGNEDYQMSNLDLIMQAYTGKFQEAIRKNLVCVQLNVNNSRYCFALSKEDLEKIDFFKNPSNLSAGGQGEYFTRTTSGDKVYTVSASGEFLSTQQRNYRLYRPTIVLPSSLTVENTLLYKTPAVKVPDVSKGIYTFLGGEWKECATL